MSEFADKVRDIADWLIDGARTAKLPTQLMSQTCERLVAAGMPLWRVGIFVRTLHPDVFGRNFIWRPGEDVVVGTADFDIQDSPEFVSSPLRIVFLEAQEVRCRIDDSNRRFAFFDEDMRSEGVTDYFAQPLIFVDGSIHAASWTTKAAGGFTDEQVEALRQLSVPLSRLIEIVQLRRTAVSLLDTYVGNRAGERILGGQIRRGHAETMNAAIWLSDLRGFTPLSDRLPAETVVKILNLYFDCQVGPIRAHGGEVLKFMGYGLLVVFPIADDAAEVCARVRTAALECAANVSAMRFADDSHAIDSFRFGVALHVGKILYGNIGGGNRLDFTCIGPAVNLAARLEKLTSRLGRAVVASADFVAACGGDWTDLGEFPVAGFSSAARVYGLAEDAGAIATLPARS